MGTAIHAHAENVQLRAENEKLKAGIKAVRDLIDDSYGVSGLHLDGSVADWASLQEGGHFEDWLLAFNEAEKPEIDMSVWTKVGEKMPAANTQVLVRYLSPFWNYRCMTVAINFDGTGRFRAIDGGRIIENPTHWATLPEHPDD